MKQKTQLIVLGVLLVFLAAMAYGVLFQPARRVAKKPGGATETAATSPDAASIIPPVAQLAVLTEWLAPEKPVSVSLRCPEAALGVGRAATDEFGEAVPADRAFAPPPMLKGVLIRNGAALALIGDGVYAVGDPIPNTKFTVASIQGSAVRLVAADGESILLNLSK